MKHDLKSFRTAQIAAALVLSVCALAWFSPVLANQSVAVVGQVTTSSAGKTINSTDAVATGDTVQWTAYFQSTLKDPSKSEGLMTLPPGFKWIKGAINNGASLPANLKLEYEVAGVFTLIEPANGTVVTAVKWVIDPTQVIIIDPEELGVINFSGTGDGFRVIPYKNRFYVVNHHQESTYLNCRLASGSLPCPGFEGGGKSMPAFQGWNAWPDFTSRESNFKTPIRSIEHVDQATGNMYVYGVRGQDVVVRCLNLNPIDNPATAVVETDLKACANEEWMGKSLGSKEFAVNPIGSVGSKYYASMSFDTFPPLLDARILCYDTATQKPCPGQPYDMRWGGSNAYTSSYIEAGRLYLAAGGVTDGKGASLKCFDTTFNLPCWPWAAGVPNNTWDMEVRNSVFPHLNSDGSFKGICTAGTGVGVQCRDRWNVPFTPSANYSKYLINSGFWGRQFDPFFWHGQYANIAVLGSRVFQSDSAITTNYANCFDFSTDQPCFSLNTTDGGLPKTYSIIKDPIRSDCMWALGDAALAKPFNPKTGLNCPTKPVSIPPLVASFKTSDYYNCDSSKRKVTEWEEIRFSDRLQWSKTTGVTNITVTIKDAKTDKELPAPYSPRSFVYGTYALSIKDVPIDKYPDISVSASVDVINKSAIAIQNEFGFDITWTGDPLQLCVKTVAPTIDCGSNGATLVQTNTAVATSKPATETADDATALSRENNDIGVGPGVETTTLRQYPKGSSDPTQIMQTKYDLNTFTGGLYQYELLADLSVSSSPLFNTTTLDTGSLWLSTPVSRTSNVDMKAMTHDKNFTNLSTAQQAALNTSMAGVVDNKGGARYSYIWGDAGYEIKNKGMFRNRTSVWAPALGSSPVVLLKKPLAGFREEHYPGYAAFQKTTKRVNTMAFYQGNEGLLHAYDVLYTYDKGLKPAGFKSRFSFMPGTLLMPKNPSLPGAQFSRYTDATLSDLRKDPYLLDGTPLLVDANLGDKKVDADKWRTVLLANQGRGGSTVYALDVTTGNLDSVLFEYNKQSHDDLMDLGLVVSPAITDKVVGAEQVVRLQDQRWVYVMGNGIRSNENTPNTVVGKSATGKAALYLFYLNAQSSSASPKRWIKVPIPSTGPTDSLNINNGLSTPRPVDINGDGSIDLVYAGDIQGNLWRFDVQDTSNIKVTKLFKTQTGQPIYTAPVVTRLPRADKLCSITSSPQPCFMVSFGTGELIDVLGKSTDVSNKASQAFYGVYDAADGAVVDASKLVSQDPIKDDVTTRTLSTKTVTYGPGADGVRGWKLSLMSLIDPKAPKKSWAEAVTTNPVQLANGQLLFASGRLEADAGGMCFPTKGWLTIIDPASGAASGGFSGNSSSISIDKPLLGNDVAPIPGGSRTTDAGTIMSRDPANSGAKTGGGATLNLPTISGRLSWREVFGLPK
jgi:hypothetical protein